MAPFSGVWGLGSGSYTDSDSGTGSSSSLYNNALATLQFNLGTWSTILLLLLLFLWPATYLATVQNLLPGWLQRLLHPRPLNT